MAQRGESRGGTGADFLDQAEDGHEGVCSIPTVGIPTVMP